MKNVLFIICGNCRTFTSCVDSIYDHVISKLFDSNYNIHVYLYLKRTDPGPKGQEGWDFHYRPVSIEQIEKAIQKLKKKGLVVNYKIIENNEISDSDLMKQVRNRNRYIGFYSEDRHLIRGLHCHYNLERCGEYILQKEKELTSSFEYIVYMRPDLYFTSDSLSIASYSSSAITLGTGPNTFVNDHIAIIPRIHVDSFFFGRMKIYRTNNKKFFDIAESVYCHGLYSKTAPIGTYFIKRE